VAHANLGQRKEAIFRLQHVEKLADDNPLYSAATRILNQLRREADDSPTKPKRLN
jgi:hypothetical protein